MNSEKKERKNKTKKKKITKTTSIIANSCVNPFIFHCEN